MTNRKTYTSEEIIKYFICSECGGKLGLTAVKDEHEQAWCPVCRKTHTGVMPEVYAAVKRVKYNMEYLNLTERQAEIHDIIMLSNMDTWPSGLLNFLRSQGKYGFCGELIVFCVAEWIAGREGDRE